MPRRKRHAKVLFAEPSRSRVPLAGLRAFLSVPCLILLLLHPRPATGVPDPTGGEDLGRIEAEIERLTGEMEKLSASERGILDELNRLDALERLRATERDSLDGRIGELELRIADGEARIEALERSVERTTVKLRSRLRALYRQGALRHYRIILAADDPTAIFGAFRHASAIMSADAALIGEVRGAHRELAELHGRLVEQRSGLQEARDAAERSRRQADLAGKRKRALLASIREDRQVRAAALSELRRASEALGRLAGGIDPGRPAPDVSMRFERFRGLLSWPAEGEIASRFGKIMHPRFQTVVPHDGIDISASYGADIRAVFDGTVAYASWFRGYGLTLMIDHGGGYVSVSAHASVLLVERGERVRGGQVVGKVGDTGSLGGPKLYFEIRERGRPVDPLLWLRRR